ncbi:hypothetical protein SAMN05892883_2065 [Jatrophihabitans sp. GAS493]|uniref:hypothetical protein n=1 Tax=Jatrophihabitans sp. GAS493 TaxID=1907575 RepID=UPI000BB72B64|nr:hypothetical protein [Jatrophihabitans sp. GAS493]SOD72715.1 hypothetical protein SAMN05892883_2065 [Jatrophihabitans sp. GAS493]
MSSPRVVDPSSLGQVVAGQKYVQPTDVTVGLVILDSSGNPQLSVGGVTQAGVKWLCASPVNTGDRILVLLQAGQCYAVGPVFNASPLPPAVGGTVLTVPTDSVTIIIDTIAGNIEARFIDGYTPLAGDPVILIWTGSQPVAVPQGVTGTPSTPTPTPVPVPKPPPKPATHTGTTTFVAASAASYRVGDGWRDDANGDVIQGTAPGVSGANSGAWFYGGRPKATLAGATVRSAQIYLGRTSGGTSASQNLNLQRVTNNSRPAGALTFAGSVSTIGLAVGQKGWFTIPAALAQALVTSGGSLGITGSPYMRLFGLTKSGQAGALKLTWSR